MPAFTCKFLVLSSVWAGVLQQVSEEMLVPEVERAGLIHNKIPGTAAAPPVSNSTHSARRESKPNQAVFVPLHSSILSSNVSTKITQVFCTSANLWLFPGIQ